jgi:hypothetical protein
MLRKDKSARYCKTAVSGNSSETAKLRLESTLRGLGYNISRLFTTTANIFFIYGRTD